MKRVIIILLALPLFCQSQNLENEISLLKESIVQLDKVRDSINKELNTLKLQNIIIELDEIGYPSNNYIKHKAMVLEYAEEYEQARWVMHMILPDIKTGKVARTNDFRVDSLVLTKTAVQQDYFLSDTLTNGEVIYDGFGYDRGHLAANADFSWSAPALSESYLYSNMSPQDPKFNQKKWAELESFLRSYVIKNNVPLYVFTAPVLHPNLKIIERGINHISIPEQFIKVAYDKINNRAIAFAMPNKSLHASLETFAISVDDAEAILQMNIFPTIDEKVESNIDKNIWLDANSRGDVEPLSQPNLPPQHFNTIVGARKVDKNCTICGTVVSWKYSRKGHLWLNLDKQYPNQLFSIFINKTDLQNFPYQIEKNLASQEVCFTGLVKSYNDTPVIYLESKNKIKFLTQILQ